MLWEARYGRDYFSVPKMNATSPVVNQIRLVFFILLAFFLEWSLSNRIEESISPMSVRMTGGRNQFETSPHSHGRRLRMTAMSENIIAMAAAFFSP